MSPEKSSGVARFRELLKSETERLTSVCEAWEAKVASSKKKASDPEAVEGHILSAVGKARLLMNKKGRFEQFSGLIDNCEFKKGEKETTVMDLQGFWDMIYFQVEDVDRLFGELVSAFLTKKGLVQ